MIVSVTRSTSGESLIVQNNIAPFNINIFLHSQAVPYSQSILEDVVVLFFLKWKWKSLSHVWLYGTPWTIQSMGFSRPEYWSGEPFSSPGDLPNPGVEPRSPALQVDSLPAEPQGTSIFLKVPFLTFYFPAQVLPLFFHVLANQGWMSLVYFRTLHSNFSLVISEPINQWPCMLLCLSGVPAAEPSTLG